MSRGVRFGKLWRADLVVWPNPVVPEWGTTSVKHHFMNRGRGCSLVPAGEDQFVPVGFGDFASEIAIDEGAQTVEEAIPVFDWQCEIARIRRHQREILFASRRDFLPDLMHRHEIEVRARGDFGRVWLLVPWGQRHAGGCARYEALVASLGRGEEIIIATRDVAILNDCEIATMSQRCRTPGEPCRAVEPVKRGRGEDEIEGLGRMRPILEGGHHNLDVREGRQIVRGERGHRWAGFDRRNGVPAFGESTGSDAGTGADLQNAGTSRQAGQLGERIEERGRIARAHEIVEIGLPVETETEGVQIGVGHTPAFRGSEPGNISCKSVPGISAESEPVGWADFR